MPRKDHRWYHTMWNTYCSWLPGDPRGFRNRHHRIHSNGDYKNPPPPGEHAGLHRYNQRQTSKPITLDQPVRKRIAESMAELLLHRGIRFNAITICRLHAHLLVELPTSKDKYKPIITKLKTSSSAAVRDVLPGRVWQRGDTTKPINDKRYQRAAFEYIAYKQERGAFVLTFHDFPDQQLALQRGEEAKPK
ncbi:MAG: transposase [Planctomycetota bacterium]